MNEENKPLWLSSVSFLKSTIDLLKQKKEQIKSSNAQAEQTWRINDSVNLYSAQFNTTDKQLQEKYNVASRWAELAWMIVDYWKDNWIEITWSNEEILNTYLRWNPDKATALYNFTHWDQDPQEFAMQMWWIKAEWPKETMDTKDVAAIEWWTALWLWANKWILNIGGKWLEKIWENLYSSAFAPDYMETKKWTQAGWDVLVAEERLKKAETALNEAKKSWEWVEEATKAFDEAKKVLEEARNVKVVKKPTVWLEYGLAWTRQKIANQAYAEAKLLFEDTIIPALKNSNSSIDVQALIGEIEQEIPKLAKENPPKLKAYMEALEEMKQDYSSFDFADFPLERAQDLKSGLQGRTPQKFYKRKWVQAEITDEYKELEWILWSKLRKSLISELEKWWLTNAEQLYQDWAKLDQIAEDANQALSKWTMNTQLWNPKNALFKSKDLSTATRTRVGKALNKVWKRQQDVVKRLEWWETTSKILKWTEKVLKIGKKWLTLLDKLLTPLMYYDAASYALRPAEERNQEALNFIKDAVSNWEQMDDDVIKWLLKVYESSDGLLTITEEDIRRAIAEWEAERQGMELLPEWMLK